ncbi:MAG: CCA tRNA nucleotidyltransferase [Amylibacter sp.]
MKLTADWVHDANVQRLFSAFEDRGHQIFFVGGCVRNALLNCAVADLDVSTSAIPEQTISVAKSEGFKFIPTGLEHGTITIIIGDRNFEVTSFRKDVETHGRRAVVAFSNNIMDDALRRDFTMNALYADYTGEVIDPLSGMGDLKNRKVRFIADAQDRIKEDYLRILRYFRFHAWYANQEEGMDQDAMAAIAENIEGLGLISKERIGAELRKILSAADPVRTIATMENCGVLAHIIPGSSARALGPLTLLEETAGLKADWQRRLLALGGTDQSAKLRLSRAESKRIATFHKAMDRGAGSVETAYWYGKDTALDLALIIAATLETHTHPDLLNQINEGSSALFPVAANDLSKTINGKAIGDALRALETEWVASGFAKTKQELLANV